MNLENKSTKVFALGGLGEVGKNMYCVMHEDELIILDAGVSFPESDLLGVDYVIQDYSFLKKNESKIKALFITHGHEDHIGGIPFLVQMVNIPVIYAPNHAMGLIRHKLKDRNVQYKNLIVYNENNKISFKHLSVEFFINTHSIPDSHGFCVTTPNGIIVTTGDFKFDFNPIGPMANLHKIAEIGKRGVSVLLSDSTNALSSGISLSESKVDNTLSELFKSKKGRIIVATFASNVYRLKHIIDNCKRNDRKIAVFGRSMDNNIEISIQGGYISNKDVFVTPEEANKLPDHKVCLLCTGSQGEPLAALSRIANGTHKNVKLRPTDTIIFSSSPIPGNALSVDKTINKLFLQGVEVYTNTILSTIHASGHGHEEELKLMLHLIKPKFFMPFHGEYRMLKRHAEIAQEIGIAKENTFIMGNGDVLTLTNGVAKKEGYVQAGDIYIDGNRIGDISSAVIKERQIMANDGIIVMIANIDIKNKKLINRPNITTRGFVQISENEELLNSISELAKNVIFKNIKTISNIEELRTMLNQELNMFIYNITGRKPIILSEIIEINK